MSRNQDKPLEGQKAIVTGADSGIGAAVALGLARAGAAVGVNHRGDDADAQALVERIRDDGGQAMALEADVSSEDEVEAMVEAFVRVHGRLDILVANAGLQQDAPITRMTLEQWRQVIDVNLTGQFLCARAAIKRFLEQEITPASCARGKIICMSSVHQVIPWAGHVNYAASKGGVMLMMQSLALEVAGSKIRINAIAPGAVKTKINEAVWSDPAQAAKMLAGIPYGRIGDPQDIARAAVWLASDEADYVVGTTLFVDGGLTLYPNARDHD
jgi:glucose 1-dehydrogenase